MLIVLSSNGSEKDSLLSLPFGRCAFFAFYDDETDNWSFEPNPAAQEASGAGIKAARFVIDKNSDVLLTGELGPKASQVIGSSPIQVYLLPEVSLDEAIRLYREGKAQKLKDNTNDPSYGHNTSYGNKYGKNANGDNPEMKRLAIATEQNQVAPHFGRCEGYTLVDLRNSGIINQVFIPSPGHEPGFLPRFLGEKGVHCIIAGGMGPRAQQLFAQQNISFIIGVTGPVDEAINTYIKGQLTGGESLCDHNHQGHQDCERE